MKAIKSLIGKQVLRTGKLEYKHVDIEFPITRNLNIVFLTDLHYSVLSKDPLILDRGVNCMREELLEEVLEATRTVEPDLVFFGGDFVNFDGRSIHCMVPFLESIAKIPKYGTYAVCGNHEFKLDSALDEVVPVLKKCGIKFLWNEYSLLDHFGENIAICGLADYFSCMVDVRFLGEIPEDIPRLVLSHNPDCMHMVKPYRVDLMLSGHTHGGQVRLPVIGSIPPLIYRFYNCFPKSFRRKLPYASQANAVQHWIWNYGLHEVTRKVYDDIEKNSSCRCLEPKYFEYGNGIYFQGDGQKIDFTAEDWDGRRQIYISKGLGTHPPMRLGCRPELSIIHLEATRNAVVELDMM